MATPTGAPLPSDSNPADSGLNGPWTAYSLWAYTSRYHKRRLDLLTAWSLWLAIGGAAAATFEQQLKSGELPALFEVLNQPAFTIGVGVVSGLAIAFAAFLSQQAQADNRVSLWTKSRSVAESLKSGIVLYRVAAPPFDGDDRAAQMKQRLDKIITDMAAVEPRQPPPKTPPNLGPMTVDQYIKDRVADQIEWYRARAATLQRQADFYRGATVGLTGIGVLLAVLAYVKPGFSAWTPVVATIAASITAYLKSQQYQMLIATYTSTRLRLTSLLDEWRAGHKTEQDKVERNAFIQRCEDTMSNENGAWTALWTKKN
jgi:hypothetical protein